MNTLDLSPLFRTAIGFDRLARLMDTARATDAPSYPPYNIERTADDAYTLTMAVAGFGQDDIEITAHDNVLVVSGKAPQMQDDGRFLHRGIAGRAFERRFVLADHIRVEGASLENGLLHVALKREVPEALKPRRIAISNGRPQQPAIEGRTEAANSQDSQVQVA
ncbi:Hsp20 family protein [Roseomonas xinghualingensis]|uniref:Hsp20 family protein n=1 Tax=Roseomonas xinghualingensis TaxID=2986475 RepID=UPI0021F24962|nr:Hsp20 family protein [Roseomonas sp. SXEYE001]MCV4207297.1 Hsp20 family protein [Roseomonas sp. SXEYE001]